MNAVRCDSWRKETRINALIVKQDINMKFNPTYLWYSIILFFPPVHEMGHVIIDVLIGEKIIKMEFTCVYVSNTTSLDFLNTLWQYSILIPLICVIIWAYLLIKKFRSYDLVINGEGRKKIGTS